MEDLKPSVEGKEQGITEWLHKVPEFIILVDKMLLLPFCTKNWSSLSRPASNISPADFLYLWIKVRKDIQFSTSLDMQQTTGAT